MHFVQKHMTACFYFLQIWKGEKERERKEIPGDIKITD